MGSYKYASLQECISAAEHLVNCDNDGYCHACGSQACPEEFPKESKPKKRKPRVRKSTTTRKSVILEVKKDLVQNELLLGEKDSLVEDIPIGLLRFMELDMKEGDEIEVTAKIVSRLKRVRL